MTSKQIAFVSWIATMRQKIFGIRLILILASIFIGVIAIMMVAQDTTEKKDLTIFGEVKVKPDKQHKPNNKLSNYQEIREGREKFEKRSLRYQVKIKKENPFLSFYQEDKKLNTVHSSTSQKNSLKKEIQQAGFLSVQNPDIFQEKKFFKAIFRETQRVQSGKALRIILQESIPHMNLEAGTILKGIPNLVGERINIQITAGIIGQDIRKLNLICFDKEDCIEGIYNDQLAKQLEEATKEGLLDEIFNLDFKGKSIAQKATDLTRMAGKLTIEKGKEIFVSLPQDQE